MKEERAYANGWELVKGYPVVLDEPYEVSGYLYYVMSDDLPMSIWRKKIERMDNPED